MMTKKPFDWTQVTDELCECGHRKSLHYGIVNHLHCTFGNLKRHCDCGRFTWSAFLGRDGKKTLRK